SKNNVGATRAVTRRGQTREPVYHYQGGPFNFLRAGGVSYERSTRTRDHVGLAGHNSAEMNMSILTTPTESLVFNWSAPRRRNAAVAGFLMASLLIHAAGLYI